MPYWLLVTRSFRIAWDHRYLWLLAIFSGEAGTSFNYSQRRSTTTAPNFPAFQQQVTAWISSHIALLISIGVVWLVLIIAFFILGAVCEGATIRASAEHDAERPFGLGPAWRTGVHLLWVMVRFRLLIVALTLPLVLLVGGWAIAFFVAVLNNNGGAVGPLILSGFLLAVVWFVYAIYLYFLDRFGSRAVVLEERMAAAAIGRAHRLLFKRFGRALLVGLIAVGVGLVVVIALGVILVPFAGIAASALASGSGAGITAGALVAAVVAVIFIVVAAFLAAQSSTYWTLAFRRLDLDYAPAYAAPVAPPA